MPQITAHHLPQSRSLRIPWLLEEPGLPHHLARDQRDARTLLAPAAPRQIHPPGKSPVVLVDGEVLADSGAIVEALAERFGAGRLLPAPGTPEAAQARGGEGSPLQQEQKWLQRPSLLRGQLLFQ